MARPKRYRKTFQYLEDKKFKPLKSSNKKKQFNRRKFLGTSLATAVTLGHLLFIRNLNFDRKVNVGILGVRFGLRLYIHEHPKVNVEAVSDLLTERRKKLMKTYRCTKSYDSLELLLKDPKIEAVAIFTPAPDHADHVLQTLAAGKHVLCAVPAAIDRKSGVKGRYVCIISRCR